MNRTRYYLSVINMSWIYFFELSNDIISRKIRLFTGVSNALAYLLGRWWASKEKMMSITVWLINRWPWAGHMWLYIYGMMTVWWPFVLILWGKCRCPYHNYSSRLGWKAMNSPDQNFDLVVFIFENSRGELFMKKKKTLFRNPSGYSYY